MTRNPSPPSVAQALAGTFDAGQRLLADRIELVRLDAKAAVERGLVEAKEVVERGLGEARSLAERGLTEARAVAERGLTEARTTIERSLASLALLLAGAILASLGWIALMAAVVVLLTPYVAPGITIAVLGGVHVVGGGALVLRSRRQFGGR